MKQTWKIEYEIPPLRAIYFAEMDAENEAEVREAVAEWEPLWRIRKLMTRIQDGGWALVATQSNEKKPLDESR